MSSLKGLSFNIAFDDNCSYDYRLVVRNCIDDPYLMEIAYQELDKDGGWAWTDITKFPVFDKCQLERFISLLNVVKENFL